MAQVTHSVPIQRLNLSIFLIKNCLLSANFAVGFNLIGKIFKQLLSRVDFSCLSRLNSHKSVSTMILRFLLTFSYSPSPTHPINGAKAKLFKNHVQTWIPLDRHTLPTTSLWTVKVPVMIYHFTIRGEEISS